MGEHETGEGEPDRGAPRRFIVLLSTGLGGGQILISLSCQTVSSPVLLIIPDVTIPKQENQQQLSIISNSMGDSETDQRSWSW